MKNLNDFEFYVWLLNGEEFVLYTVSDMTEVELPEGFSLYRMLYDRKKNVMAACEMVDGYEVVGWIIAKGLLPCIDGRYPIARHNSLHATLFNDWAYGKLAVLDHNTGEVISISLDVLLEDSEEIEDFCRTYAISTSVQSAGCSLAVRWFLWGQVTTVRFIGHPNGGAAVRWCDFALLFPFNALFYDSQRIYDVVR